MNPEKLSIPEGETDDELVAYLDGELDATATTVVEERLAEDADFRTRLAELQAAWDLLDELPRAQATADFTQTTVEMVAVSAKEDVQAEQQQARQVNLFRNLTVIGGILAAALLGFVLIRGTLLSEDRALIRDLPVIENFDLYRNIEDVDFLRRLDEESLFSQEESDDVP